MKPSNPLKKKKRKFLLPKRKREKLPRSNTKDERWTMMRFGRNIFITKPNSRLQWKSNSGRDGGKRLQRSSNSEPFFPVAATSMCMGPMGQARQASFKTASKYRRSVIVL